ncbi:MAG: phenylalanine 4-monooxygenase [Holophagales bacterium]|nr:phenylalanine 4-monooxygenase [Holophagales bacterium]MYF04255.1 phenylalanine 4-monooxygenase [Holophagales bacterium]
MLVAGAVDSSREHSIAGGDLTTGRAAFIERAQTRGDLFVEQPYGLYGEANQETWRRLYRALAGKWERYAHPRFLDGVARLGLDPDRIPRLEDVNRFLEPLSGFRARAVSGYVPAYLFFDCLRRREFPTTITVRDGDRLDYLPEPDIFHDLAGHVPMHTDPAFADVLVRFGEAARTAALRARDGDCRSVESGLKALARFFWFTIEFGLMRRPGGAGLCAYGSGLLSSAGEIAHSLESPSVQRVPFQLEWVVNQSFEIDSLQPLLFVVDSFRHLEREVRRLERWLGESRLDNVAAGEPAVSREDLRSFLDAGRQ